MSQLTTSAEPLAVAEAFRAHFATKELYLVDLGAINGGAPALPLYDALHSHGFRLWVDAGASERAQALPLVNSAVARIVVGPETADDPRVLEALCREFGDRLVFSLGPKDKNFADQNPLGNTSALDVLANYALAEKAISAGVRHLIVPALARVEGEEGADGLDLCRRLMEAYPEVEVVSGSNVYDVPNLGRLRQLGVGAVLVASALHDGRLRCEDLAEG